MQQEHCPRAAAMRALRMNEGDICEAILDLERVTYDVGGGLDVFACSSLACTSSGWHRITSQWRTEAGAAAAAAVVA